MPGEKVAEVIRRSTPADIPGLRALFVEAFGHDRPPEIWQWKYFDNPRGHASYLCEAGDRIVAHCAGLPVVFRDHERRFTAYQSVDFMSSQSHAGGIGGGGVFLRTTRRMFKDNCGPDEVPLVYGFPGERHRLLGERLLGYRPVEIVNELRLDPKGSTSVVAPLTTEDLGFFCLEPHPLGAIRDEFYLGWRYRDHPVHHYGTVTVKGILGRRSIGAIVRETDEGVVHLMELGGSFSRARVRKLVDELGALGRPVVGWGSPSNPLGRLLVESGFVATPRDHHLEVRFFRERPTPREGEIYYTLGDYDVY